MSDLIAKIRSAKIRAGEAAVCDHFWHSEDRVVQFHPPESEHINNHTNCLHLWRPVGVEMPAPPAWMVGVKEWKWLERNPFDGVRRPKSAPHRDRRISEDEIERLLYCMGYDREQPPVTATARAGAALLWAIETAMRAGEICALQWEDVEIERRFARVRRGKTEAAKRDVPLSSEALRIAGQLAGVRDGPLVFQLRAASLDALFRKAKRKAGLADADLHFHDTRHEGITRLASVLGVLELARAVGHRDLRMLQTYYNATAEDIAKKLK